MKSTMSHDRCSILGCWRTTSGAAMCGYHERERERMSYRHCEACGLGGYEWGVLVPEVRARADGRKLCHACFVASSEVRP